MDSTEYKIHGIPEVRRNNTTAIGPAGVLSDQIDSLLYLTKKEIKMKNLKFVFFAILALALMAVVVTAQSPEELKALAAKNAVDTTVLAYKAIGGGIGFGLAAGLAGIGQGLVGSRAAEGAARNPGAAGAVQTMMIIALALIESLVLFALLIVFVKL